MFNNTAKTAQNNKSKITITIKLAELFLAGKCSAAQTLKVEAWYQSFNDEDDHVSGLDEPELSKLEDRIYKRIGL